MGDAIIQIRSNRFQLFGTILFQTVLIVLLILGIMMNISPNATISKESAICFLLIVIVGNVLIFVPLFCLPIGVAIDEVSQILQIKFLLKANKTVLLGNIDSYSSTRISGKGGDYDGILLKIKNSGKILLSDFNLHDYSPVKKYLEESKVEFTGKEKFTLSYYWNAK